VTATRSGDAPARSNILVDLVDLRSDVENAASGGSLLAVTRARAALRRGLDTGVASPAHPSFVPLHARTLSSPPSPISSHTHRHAGVCSRAILVQDGAQTGDEDESRPMSPACRWQEAELRDLGHLVSAPITPPLDLWPHQVTRNSQTALAIQGRGDQTSSCPPSSRADAERGAGWQPAEDLPGQPAPGLCWGSINGDDRRGAGDPSTETIEGRAAPEVYTVPASILSFAEHESDEEDTGVDVKRRRRNSCTRIVSRIYDEGDDDQERPVTLHQLEKASCPSGSKRPHAGSGRCEDSRKRRRRSTTSVKATTNWCTEKDCDASVPAVIHH